jgi:membrane fusion protein (multidrug efflux system)
MSTPSPTQSQVAGEAKAVASPAEAPHAVSPAPPAPASSAPAPKSAAPGRRRGWSWIIVGIILLAAVIAGIPWFLDSLATVSTDDAYVNGHVTFVAPRVSGQVARVLVDDNNRVHKGDLLVQIDREPFLVEQRIAQSAVVAAQEDLVAARAQARGQVGQARALRFNLEHTIEDVGNQIALLHSKVASLQSQKASLDKAQADFDRATPLAASGVVSKDEIDLRKESLLVAQARVEEALQGVYQVRVSLGLPAKPEKGDDLTQVPADLDQTFSSVRQAQASLIQAAAQIGVVDSFNKSPRQMIADFYKRDPQGDIDNIYTELLKKAPVVKQAEAKVAQAQRLLDEADLNLKYCDVVAEIDGVVTRRNVNPGNNIVVGQNLMAIRSLTEIWIDANFKETQLADLRIGQAVDVDVDMYGRHQMFKGRISGFTMGTGSTLALLPAQNATGNFVKVVQRLPVRIDLVDYDPDKTPLFIGLSVEPRVRIKEAPTGPSAGKVMQPYSPAAPDTAPATQAETQP